MMAQKFKGLFFTSFSNPGDDISTNRELSMVEMAVR
jgi:hypothetical protein